MKMWGMWGELAGGGASTSIRMTQARTTDRKQTRIRGPRRPQDQETRVQASRAPETTRDQSIRGTDASPKKDRQKTKRPEPHFQKKGEPHLLLSKKPGPEILTHSIALNDIKWIGDRQ